MTNTTGARPGTRKGRDQGLKIERIYTTPGVHPYDEVTWERRDVVQVAEGVNQAEHGADDADRGGVAAHGLPDRHRDLVLAEGRAEIQRRRQLDAS